MRFTTTFISLLVIIFLSNLSLEAQELSKIQRGFKINHYRGDELITKKDFIAHLKTNEKAIKHWSKSRVFNTLSIVSLASEFGFAAWNLSDGKDKNRAASTGLYSSLGAVFIFSFIQGLQEKKAISEYNKAVKKTNTVSFKPSKKGLGIVFEF